MSSIESPQEPDHVGQTLSPNYLVAIYVVTGGQHGDDLGSDEEEIVQFAWMIIDVSANKVLEKQSQRVRPKSKDINDNILSEIGLGHARDHYGLEETSIKTALTLHEVLAQLDARLATLGPFGLVTDGQLHLRQVLHPEAHKKTIALPSYFYRFFDVRKEFCKFYRNMDMHNIEDMLFYLSIKKREDNVEEKSMEGDSDPASISPLMAMDKLDDMAKLIHRLITDGHQFNEHQIINDRLEPGLCSKNEFVDNNTVVRARGLPWQSSDQDIANFFIGLNIIKGGVALCLSAQGRRNGEALIRFANQEHRDMALRRHKHHIGQRYIEVYRATGDDFLNVAGGNNNEAYGFLSQGGQAIVRMRGLPYDATPAQVIEFFENDPACHVMGEEGGVLFVRKPDGRPTGDAFVMFETEEIAARALLKHRELIGSRYIELFRSTTAEVQQVFNRTTDMRMYENAMAVAAAAAAAASVQPAPPPPLLPALLHPSVAMPSTAQASSNRRDCIRLRGLPYEAQVEQILEFLGDHSKNIVCQGVHMVFNAQGQPSGEAFIQMNTEQSALLAAQQRHHHYMYFGKKQRYIEVFSCSVEDMNLTSGMSHLQHANFLPASYAFPYMLNGAGRAGMVVPPPPYGVTPGVSNPFNHMMCYWPYPSPPVSPTTYFAAAAAAANAHQPPTPPIVNMRGLR